jgi:hypothetical protein
MENDPHPSKQSILVPVLIIGGIVFSIITGAAGYIIGTNNQTKTTADPKQPIVAQASPTPSVEALSSPGFADVLSATSAPVAAQAGQQSNVLCAKNGFAKPQEYLKPYVLKANDSAQSVAEDQLHDGSRVNEILKINGQGPFPGGATLYLPPDNVPSSSGNLRQVYGKLVEQNLTSWHISFTADKSGQGVLIPSYLFQTVPNKNAINIGDCLRVFFDDGYTVYSVDLQ